MTQHRVLYKGSIDDFEVFVDSPTALREYKKKPDSTALIDVVNNFKIYVTHRTGAQGILDEASRASLESEFGSKDVDHAIKEILLRGEFLEQKYNDRSYDSKNDSMGSRLPR
ncbi:ribosome maturation protein [Limtongia smithiae]|uniref:ribosome maturation protein n=1 Tax=Limtongia smithiae TaxID=1125753 RepID=UPI0034CD9E93